METCLAFTWSEWRFWEIVACILAGGLALITVLVFLAALWETRRLRPVFATEQDPAKPMPPVCVEAHEAALSAGFLDSGVFTDDDKGFKKGYATVLLSPEEDVLVLVQWGTAIKRFRLLSHFETGQWFVTTNSIGESDLSGQWEEVVIHDAKLLDALNEHYERIVASGLVPLLFDAQAIPEHLLEQQRQRVDRLIEKGLAKHLNAERDTWRYTPKGAVLLAARSFRQMLDAINQGTKAKSESKQKTTA